jgi:DNA-binding response OmpR family regulator
VRTDERGSCCGCAPALDRVLAHLARATLLAIDGRDADAAAAVTRVWQAAASEALDTDLVADVIAGLGDVVVITGADDRRLAQASALAVPAELVVIDARSHELTVGGAPCSLKRRSVLRRLLYALARRPGSVLGKDELAEAVWDRPYDPVRHDDALKSNILHLRRLLAGTGLVIARGDPGYRLDAVGRFVFIAPFELVEDRRFAVTDLALRRAARATDAMPGDAGTAGAG